MLKKILLLVFMLICSVQVVFCIEESNEVDSASVEWKIPYIKSTLDKKLKPLADFTFTRVPRGIVISIAEDEFFLKNSSEITKQGEKLLDILGEVLKEINNECTVEGHSEEVLPENSVYKNTWEITVTRAENIVDYLIVHGYVLPRRIHSIGFGEFMPFERNVTGRDFTDNRVNFVIFDYTVED